MLELVDMKTIEVSSGKILGVHRYALEACGALTFVRSLVQEPNLFSEQQLLIHLKIKPICVVKAGTEYEVIAGFREWMLARKILKTANSIPVSVFKVDKKIEIEKIAFSDVYSVLLTVTPNPKQLGYQIHQVLNHMPERIKNELYPNFKSATQVAKATALSRSSFYPNYQNKPEEEESFEDIFKSELNRS